MPESAGISERSEARRAVVSVRRRGTGIPDRGPPFHVKTGRPGRLRKPGAMRKLRGFT